MRIVSWNCNLKLVKKFEVAVELKPDILIVQECEKLSIDHFPNAQFHWIGNSEKKGLGVVLFNEVGSVDASYNDKLAFFLPINLENGMHLLAAWAFNHRAAQRFGEEYQGSAYDALLYYQQWLFDARQAVMVGDFNHSVVWDKDKKSSNFSTINRVLNESGFSSAWHAHAGEQLGKESHPTLYHTKNYDKPYHIDYCYLKGLAANNVTIGLFDDWIPFSDHMPLIVDIE